MDYSDTCRSVYRSRNQWLHASRWLRAARILTAISSCLVYPTRLRPAHNRDCPTISADGLSLRQLRGRPRVAPNAAGTDRSGILLTVKPPSVPSGALTGGRSCAPVVCGGLKITAAAFEDYGGCRCQALGGRARLIQSVTSRRQRT